MEIKNIQKEIHQDAKKKGFWDADWLFMEAYDHELDEDAIRDIVTIRQNAIISQKLMLIVSELGEALEALRNNKLCKIDIEQYINVFKYPIVNPLDFVESFVKDTFEDELADAVIRILDLAEWMKIDLESHILLKMEYNKTRPIRHGKKF